MSKSVFINGQEYKCLDERNYSKYIDCETIAREVKTHLMPNVDDDGTVTVENAERYFLNLLAKQPAEDVVKVVRCKDCGYYNIKQMICNRPCEALVIRLPDDFCSHSRKRADAGDM